MQYNTIIFRSKRKKQIALPSYISAIVVAAILIAFVRVYFSNSNSVKGKANELANALRSGDAHVIASIVSNRELRLYSIERSTLEHLLSEEVMPAIKVNFSVDDIAISERPDHYKVYIPPLPTSCLNHGVEFRLTTGFGSPVGVGVISNCFKVLGDQFALASTDDKVQGFLSQIELCKEKGTKLAHLGFPGLYNPSLGRIETWAERATTLQQRISSQNVSPSSKETTQ